MASAATVPAPEKKQRAWRIEYTTKTNLEELLNNLDAEDWHVYKITLIQDTHTFVIICQPKRVAMLNQQLRDITKLLRRLVDAQQTTNKTPKIEVVGVPVETESPELSSASDDQTLNAAQA